MKNIMRFVFLLALMAVSFGAHADATDMIFMQRNPTDTGTFTRVLPVSALGGGNGIFIFDSSTVQPAMVTLGSGLTLTSGVLTASGSPGLTGAAGSTGAAGPGNSLSIGTVTSGTAAATITGTSPSQTLNLVLPAGTNGVTGPANSLSIGTVSTGAASATITGTAPSQTLNLVLQTGATGSTGATGAAGSNATTKAYVGTTLKAAVFPIIKTATVASGVAVFNLTDDGTSTGNALCTETFIDSVQLVVNDATASYQMGWAFSNSNKTLTVTVNKLTTSNILTGILGQTAANGAAVKMITYCD